MEVISVRLRCEVERLGGETVVMRCVEVFGGKRRLICKAMRNSIHTQCDIAGSKCGE
jgi:acyl-coenzyme A thioesterase PaaI-like protein